MVELTLTFPEESLPAESSFDWAKLDLFASS